MKHLHKRIFCIAAAAALSFCVLPQDLSAPAAQAAELVDSGTCGKEAVWSLDSDGVLTVSGTGTMYGLDSLHEIPWKDEKEQIQQAVICEGITSVGGQCFSDCPNLVSVSLSDTVTLIGESAFSSCKALTEINFPDSLTRIGTMSFALCKALADVSIPESVTSIGSLAFSGTKWLNDEAEKNPFVIINSLLIYGPNTAEAEIPAGVTNIVSNAFWGRNELTALTIPDTVRIIEYNAFASCTGLVSVTIPESVGDLGMQAFSGCTALEAVTILNPDCIIYKRANTIANDNKSYSGVIYGYDKSTAAVFAEAYGYTFSSLGRAPGDFNYDGSRTVADAVLLARFLAEDHTLTAAQLSDILLGKPDLNADGLVTAQDMRVLLRKICA